MWSSSCERGCIEQGIRRTVPFRYPDIECHMRIEMLLHENVFGLRYCFSFIPDHDPAPFYG
jgi:hypothetical protein